MIRTGHKVASGQVTRLSSARRMPLWDLIRTTESPETARVLARELPLQEQLRASVERKQKEKAMTEAQPAPAASLARVQSTAIAPVVPEEKYQLLRDTYAQGCTDTEFALYVDVCNRLRLDPFARQIFAVKRWNSTLQRDEMQPQVSIDGARLQAQRTGEYRGQSEPQWCGPDGVWKDVWLAKTPPSAARVFVYREGHVKPSPGLALYSEYVQTKRDGSPTKFWRDMPAGQLAKCAESLALRKAFPNELSGVYTVDEMAQAQLGEDEPAVVAAPPRAAVPAATVERPKPAASGGEPARAATKPPPSPAPAPAQGPRFARSFPIKPWGGKPMNDAPIETLADYIVFCEGVLGDRNRSALHGSARASKAEAEAIYSRRAAAEMELTTQVMTEEELRAERDPIAEGLQAEYDRTHNLTGAGDDNIPY